MWLLRRFSVNLQTEWARDYRYVLGTAYKYQTSELVEITSMLSEMTKADIHSMSTNENIIHDFFISLVDRIPSMNTEEIMNVSRKVFLNAELRDVAMKTPWWLQVVTQLSKHKNILSLKDLSFINVALAKMRIKHIQFEADRHDLIKEIENRQISGNWEELIEVIWPYTNAPMKSQFLDEVVEFILKRATPNNIGPGMLAKIYSFIKRCNVDSQRLDSFFEATIPAILEKRCEPIDLIDTLYFTVPQVIISPELQKLVERKLTNSIDIPLASVFLTRLLSAYVFCPFATEDLERFATAEIVKQYKDFGPEELVAAGIVAIRAGNCEKYLKLMEIHYWKLMTPKNLNVISHTRCLHMAEMIYMSGCNMPNYLRSLAQYIIRLFDISDPQLGFCTRIALFYSHLQYNQTSLYNHINFHLYRMRKNLEYSSRDLCSAVITMLECPDVSSGILVKSLDDTVFFLAYSFSQEELMKVAYGLVRLNRCSPELLALVRKRILEGPLEPRDDATLALGVFALTQYNDPDYLLRCSAQVKQMLSEIDNVVDLADALLKEQPKISPIYRQFLRRPTKLPAASVVQVCMSAAATGLMNEIWTAALIAKLESYSYNPQYVHSIAPPHRVARLIRSDIPYATDLDLFHYHLLLNTLAVVYAQTMDKQAAIDKASKKRLKFPEFRYKNTERHRYPVNTYFKDEFKQLMKNTFPVVEFDTCDALGNEIEARVPGRGAFLLVDKEDYVYLSHGYDAVVDLRDLLARVKLKIKVVEMQEPRVCVIPKGKWDELTTKERKKLVTGQY